VLFPYVLWNDVWVINNGGLIRVRVCPCMPWVSFRSQLLSVFSELYTEVLYLQGLNENSGMTIYVSKLG
jgi:hypothetical protein